MDISESGGWNSAIVARHIGSAILLLLASLLLFVACLTEPDRAIPINQGSSDTGHDTAGDDTNTSPPDDGGSGGDGDAGGGDSTPPGADSDASDDASDTDDTGSEPDDTGPTDPPDPDDCGGDYWDDYHDGSNPWDPFEIDCDELAASWDCQATEDEKLILELINQARQEEQECGSITYGPSDPLEMNAQLLCAARIHSWDQYGRNYYDHDTPEGLNASARVSIVPGSLSSAAENIYDWMTTPQNIFQGWMNSTNHCKNIMCGGYTQVGIGKYGGKHTLKVTGPSICMW